MRFKNDLVCQDYDVAEDVVRKLESGEFRRKYGLDTSVGKDYHYFRVVRGFGDARAQVRVFLIRGILKRDHKQKIIREVV